MSGIGWGGETECACFPEATPCNETTKILESEVGSSLGFCLGEILRFLICKMGLIASTSLYLFI